MSDRVVDASAEAGPAQGDWALAREKRMHEIILKIASDGLHVLDAKGNLVTMSDSFCASLGYERHELLGKHISFWDASFQPGTFEERMGSLQEVNDQTFESQHRRKNG
ncbi:MAG: PAS domain S-box protein, partial [Ferrovum sp.]|nr:PAS domain S-box protein [Ferrovum sp.]